MIKTRTREEWLGCLFGFLGAAAGVALARWSFANTVASIHANDPNATICGMPALFLLFFGFCLGGLTGTLFGMVVSHLLPHSGSTNRVRPATRFGILDFSNMRMNNAGIAQLTGNARICELYLNGTDISDIGLAGLRELTKLEHLELRGTNVTDLGLEHLKSCLQLRRLCLDETRTTQSGRGELRASLPNCVISPNP